MNIILVSKFKGRPYRIQIGSPTQLAMLSILILGLASCVAFVGFYAVGATLELTDQNNIHELLLLLVCGSM